MIGAALASGVNLGYHQTHGIAPTPDTLESILMTDSSEPLLTKCIDNLGTSSFPVAKVGLGLLDWKKRVHNDMKDQFDFIIGNNCAYDFASLSKVVAYSLKLHPEFGSGTFVHIGAGNRAGIIGLNNELQRKHRLNTVTKELVLERIELLPFINEEVPTNLNIDYDNVEAGKFSLLVGYHDDAKVDKVSVTNDFNLNLGMYRLVFFFFIFFTLIHTFNHRCLQKTHRKNQILFCAQPIQNGARYLRKRKVKTVLPPLHLTSC